MLLHHVLLKRKVSLDQFIKGLKDNSVLSTIRANPEIARQLFVPDASKLEPSALLEKIVFEEDMCESHISSLKEAVLTMTESEIRSVCGFLTGVADMSALTGRRKIEVSLKPNQDAIFASTCSFELAVAEDALSGTPREVAVRILAACSGSDFNSA